jgi:hypothetical protein
MYTTSGEWSRCQRLSDLEAHSQSGKNTGTLSVACILGTGILLVKVENARSSVRKPLGGGGELFTIWSVLRCTIGRILQATASYVCVLYAVYICNHVPSSGDCSGTALLPLSWRIQRLSPSHCIALAHALPRSHGPERHDFPCVRRHHAMADVTLVKKLQILA